MSIIVYEDLIIGKTYDLGSHTLNHKSMINYAERFDPQPIHIDEIHAKNSIYKGIIASGWYTASIWMRLACDGLLLDLQSMGSPGGEHLKWLHPVRSGDTLRASLVIVNKRTSNSRPKLGIVTTSGNLTNQHQEIVFSLQSSVFVKRK